MRVEKAAQFEIDFADAALYLAEQNASVANRLIDAVEGAISLLAEHPQIGPLWQHGRREQPIRFLLVPGFRNYMIFYRLEDARLVLGRLLHGARDLQDILDEGQS